MADHVSDLTIEEFKTLIRETIREALLEIVDEAEDPDAGKEFTPEVAARLRAYLAERPEGRPLEDIVREMGLDD